jgi:hypothetical protein
MNRRSCNQTRAIAQGVGRHPDPELCTGVIAIQAACDANISVPTVEPRSLLDHTCELSESMKRQRFHGPGTAFAFEIWHPRRLAAMKPSGSLRCNTNKAPRDDL